jgi:hypothetical protein
LRVGAYNLGFFGVRWTREVVELLEWWARRLEKDCLVALERGLFVDQKWMDLWPSFCAGTTILRHPGYNVAYWNLAERKIERSDDRHLVNGQPLVFFHFSGVMPHRPDVLSKYQALFTSSNIGAADALLQSYIVAVLASGHADLERITCSYSQFENGVPIASLVRSLFRRDERRFPDPYRSVFRALQEPSDKVSPNPEGVVSVAAYEAWKLRIDVQQTFAIDTAEGQVGLARWFVGHGCAESGLDPIFARSVAERLARVPPGLAGSPSPGLVAGLGRRGVRSRSIVALPCCNGRGAGCRPTCARTLATSSSKPRFDCRRSAGEGLEMAPIHGSRARCWWPIPERRWVSARRCVVSLNHRGRSAFRSRSLISASTCRSARKTTRLPATSPGRTVSTAMCSA